MCSGNGDLCADLEPKLDLILWLGSLGLTCQGLLRFSAVTGMLPVALSVHAEPALVPCCLWQGRKRSDLNKAEVPKLCELPAGSPIGHHST